MKIIVCENGDKFVKEVDDIDAAIVNEDTIRAQRDTLLAATDWRFRVDMTPSQEWIDYCQALRDIPQQAGFPESVVWPIKP